MPPDAPLFAALAEPDDSAGFQILADWYEEQGDPRADMTRLIVELRGLSTNDPRRSEVIGRLWQKTNFWFGYRRRKETDVDCHVTLGSEDIPFYVNISASELLREGEALLPGLPPTYGVCITGDDEFDRLARSPLLERVTSLAPLESEADPPRRALYASAHLTSVRQLELNDSASLLQAARSPHLGSVTSLQVSRLDDAELSTSHIDSALFTGLKRLVIRDEREVLSFESVWPAALSQTKLTSLFVTTFNGNFTFSEFANHCDLSRLKVLSLRNVKSNPSIQQMAAADWGPKLRRLRLSNLHWETPSAVSYFERFPQLEDLDLSESNLDVDAAAALAAHPPRRVKKLNLCETKFDDEAIDRLTRGLPWPALETLLIHNTPVSADGIQLVCDRLETVFPRLKRIVAGPTKRAFNANEELSQKVADVTILPQRQPAD